MNDVATPVGPSARPERRKKRRISMHEDIAAWCDCCPCEAEPRWVEVARELGIDLCDYERRPAAVNESPASPGSGYSGAAPGPSSD